MAIDLIDFEPALSADFTRLNMAWLNKYFVVEPIDERMLSEPVRYYIDPGGFIFFARVNKVIAGTIALLKVSDTVYEVSKMAVDPQYQGNGIGAGLLQQCIDKARALPVRQLILYSNTALGPAIHLYKKFGFFEVALDKVEYKRANIKMVLDLNVL